MTKTSGLGDGLLVGGFDLSGDTNSIGRVGGGPAALDLTGIDKSAHERLGGLRDGGIDWVAYFNKTGAQPVLGALPREDTAVSYLRGRGIGSAMASMVAKQIGYDPTRGADGQLTFALASQANSFGLEWGNQLQTGASQTDTTGTNGAALDGGAATFFGAQFYLHILGFTGTSATLKIQDSADNSSWSDLAGATFAAVTGTGWQRIAVTGTVRRYLRVVSSGTFSSFRFVANAVRNEVAVKF